MNLSFIILIVAFCLLSVAVVVMLVELYRVRNSFAYYNAMWKRTVRFIAAHSSKEDLQKMFDDVRSLREEIESGGVEITVPPSMLGFTEDVIYEELRKKDAGLYG